MTNPFTPDIVATQQHLRTFIQAGGPGVLNPVTFYGVDNTFIILDDVDIPDNGGIDPINVSDPFNAKRFIQVGKTESAPDFPTVSATILEKWGGIPRLMTQGACAFNFYIVKGTCKDLSDLIQGWRDFIRIYSYAVRTSRTLPGGSWEDDNVLETSLDFTLTGGVYLYGQLSVGAVGAADVVNEVMDTTYGSRLECGDCGPQDDGTQRIYALTVGADGSPPTVPSIVFTLNGGNTTDTSDITGALFADQMFGVIITSGKIVAFTSTGLTATQSMYYWSELNSLGEPTTWNEAYGFEDGFEATDKLVLDPRNIFLSAKGGYVYKMIDVASGVEVLNNGSATTDDLYRIAGRGDVIIAGGDNGTVIKSVDKGRIFSAVVGIPMTEGATHITALEVVDDFKFWAGDDDGHVFYTIDGGNSWSEYSFSDMAYIFDIRFVTSEVGYISGTTALVGGASRLYTTFTGGRTWANSSLTGSRVLNYPTYSWARTVAFPQTGLKDIDTNNISLGGISSGGTDGSWFLGRASFIG